MEIHKLKKWTHYTTIPSGTWDESEIDPSVSISFLKWFRQLGFFRCWRLSLSSIHSLKPRNLRQKVEPPTLATEWKLFDAHCNNKQKKFHLLIHIWGQKFRKEKMKKIKRLPWLCGNLSIDELILGVRMKIRRMKRRLKRKRMTLVWVSVCVVVSSIGSVKVTLSFYLLT
jgi:hypothetical protein